MKLNEYFEKIRWVENSRAMAKSDLELSKKAIEMLLEDIKIDYSSMIDHTLLKEEATQEQIEQLCDEAIKHGFASVCVRPKWVKLCSKILEGTKVKVCTVIGFPSGLPSIESKKNETNKAIEDGAQECDMVINIEKLKEGDDQYVLNDIKAVVDECRYHAIVKVILETSILTDDEIVRGCILSKKAGANFVKTSTGYAKGGATIHAIELMKKTVGDSMQIKASGGIRDYYTMKSMVDAGATRIGTSSGINLVNKKESEGY